MSRNCSQPPSPKLLLSSLRNTGYTLKSAVADIIDNSISAGASKISILHRGSYNHSAPWIAICDDGIGMSRDTLFSSMRFGSRELNAERTGIYDLGRFGLGMKTASISQCRKLTVFSWQNGKSTAFCWDLDTISTSWDLIEYAPDEITKNPLLLTIVKDLSFSPKEHGTIVLWEKLDRDTAKLDSNMIDAMNDVAQHVAEVFHRFMQKEKDYQVIEFECNGLKILPHPPFGPEDNVNRYILRGDSFECSGYKVSYQPFILPRAINYKSGLDYTSNGGPEGYQQNQGFYVYRNRRLVEKATWFRKRKKEYKTQLLRIRLDIPAELDEQWGIDVRKSQISPPAEILNRVDSIVEEAMSEAKQLWDSGLRNVNVVKGQVEPAWSIHSKPDKQTHFSYKVNPEHEMYKLLMRSLEPGMRKVFREYMTSLSELFPYDRYYSDRNQNSDFKFEIKSDVQLRLAEIINTLVEQGYDENLVRLILMANETSFPRDLVQQFLNEKFNH